MVHCLSCESKQITISSKYYSKVFMRLPDVVVDFFLGIKFRLKVIMPTGYEYFYLNPKWSPGGDILAFTSLRSDFLDNKTENEIILTITQSLASVYLTYPTFDTEMPGAEKPADEIAIDKQVIEWGFEEEYKYNDNLSEEDFS